MRRSSRYIHELSDWPKFHWDQDRLAGTLAAVRHRQGRLVGRMEALGFPLQQEATLEALTEETVKSSEIEGQKPRRGAGPLVDRAPFGHGRGRRRRRGPPCRRRCRNDARCDAELRSASCFG